MKLNPTLAASLSAIVAALGLNASAAPDTLADAEPQKKMTPHSHVADETGMPEKAPEATSGKPNAAKDKTKHFHPRNGKYASTGKAGCQRGFLV